MTYRVTKELLAEYKDCLPYFTGLGAYPLYYVLIDPYETGQEHESIVLCPLCANKEERKVGMYYSVNWEDAEMYCEGCGNRIESAYAEED